MRLPSVSDQKVSLVMMTGCTSGSEGEQDVTPSMRPAVSRVIPADKTDCFFILIMSVLWYMNWFEFPT